MAEHPAATFGAHPKTACLAPMAAADPGAPPKVLGRTRPGFSLGRFMVRTAFLAVWMMLLVNLSRSGHGIDVRAGDWPLIGVFTAAVWGALLMIGAIGRSVWSPPSE